VLQFDIDDRVRVIGFRSIADSYRHDSASLGDVWLPSARFYALLDEWRNRFEAEWNASSKMAIASEGQ
jgi:hypothetical protein